MDQSACGDKGGKLGQGAAQGAGGAERWSGSIRLKRGEQRADGTVLRASELAGRERSGDDADEDGMLTTIGLFVYGAYLCEPSGSVNLWVSSV